MRWEDVGVGQWCRDVHGVLIVKVSCNTGLACGQDYTPRMTGYTVALGTEVTPVAVSVDARAVCTFADLKAGDYYRWHGDDYRVIAVRDGKVMSVEADVGVFSFDANDQPVTRLGDDDDD